jgi:hypothetical protein
MTTSNDITWDELAEKLFEGSENQFLKRFRSDFVFRGVSSVDYDLRTSLQRLVGDGSGLKRLDSNPAKLERAILRNFRKYAHRDASPGDSTWNWLAVAQHHGLPTRLLDWTISPYVGVYFATDEVDKHHLDGAVYCFDFGKAKEYLPKSVLDILREEHAFLFDVPILMKLAPGLSEFDAITSSEPFPLVFEPPALDDRIVNQAGLFSIMSSPTARLDEWFEAHPDVFRRIIIPAKRKPEFRDKLDMMNLTERVIYGGLDGLSKWLKRYYTPPNAKPEDVAIGEAKAEAHMH